MKIIAKGRAEGKTTKLCEFVKKQNGILLCRNQQMVDLVIREHGLLPDQAMTWEQAVHFRKLKGLELRKRPIYGDDADFFLNSLVGWCIEGISVTKP